MVEKNYCNPHPASQRMTQIPKIIGLLMLPILCLNLMAGEVSLQKPSRWRKIVLQGKQGLILPRLK